MYIYIQLYIYITGKNSTLYDGTSLFRHCLQAVLAKQVSRTWYVSSTSASRPGCGDRNTLGPTFVLSLIFWGGRIHHCLGSNSTHLRLKQYMKIMKYLQ
jgi:hypothetical protein